MRQLETIQKTNNLNRVFAVDEPKQGGANHHYQVEWDYETDGQTRKYARTIKFQKGARLDPFADHGVLDNDLLEIVKDRFTGFQSGELANDYTAQALYYVEKALEALNERVEDRVKRDVLGTYKE